MLRLKNLSSNKSRTFRKVRDKGYLLLETVVSIALIAIGLAIILRSFTSSLRASKISQEYLIATSLLKEKMWELERKARPEPEGEGGISESDAKEEKIEISNIKYELNISVEKMEKPESLDLANVEAVISWDNGNRREKIEANTFLRYKGAS